MPYIQKWVKPKVFLRHKGVKVYHFYEDEQEEDRQFYWFAMHEDPYPDPFDVRELSTWKPVKDGATYAEEDCQIRQAMRLAIDKGELKNPEGD